MEIPTLQTERLLLRAHRADDFDRYAEMNGDAEVMRYIRPPEDRATSFRSLCALMGHWALRGYGFWALEEKATGLYVGGAGLVRWEGRADVEIGYAIHPSAMGKGYATESSRRALEWAQQVLGARGLISVIHPDNLKSIRVVEKLGARPGPELILRGERLLTYRYPDP